MDIISIEGTVEGNEGAPLPSDDKSDEDGFGAVIPTLGISAEEVTDEQIDEIAEGVAADNSQAEIEKYVFEAPEILEAYAGPADGETAAESPLTGEVQDVLTSQGDPQASEVAVTDTLEHTTAVVQPDTVAIKETSPEDASLDAATAVVSEELPVKEYLDATVVPALRVGLRILAKQRPPSYNGNYHCLLSPMY
ncbi:hypothetical protein COCSUDRAFT_60566 [Coccomyxa subellipsoidea C-169]|uniref:Uncharacterized protein n=1 Tax=Coccomyxa subellipsoidea (strain C-169) TaxID=574566 RepID=I0YI47_COCSC|nr:hypothetical protein COCSUDRAFT_60566 [Coccomyxa subellipsoidea C-169]EIE18066.1 hypothetical protein COCSUDRAFT_60566 [Coccomyxa subellipsoidea C-169]|eukprot:XP_005642610.1 hypothetical protein COCSUDRAFT_60566 [Coccomyxa subellipsoidea C-169]